MSGIPLPDECCNFCFFPMLCITTLGHIYFITRYLYLWPPFIQFTLPLQPLTTTNLFSVSMSLIFVCLHVYCFFCFYFFCLDSTCKGYNMVYSFSIWLISLSIMPSRCIHVITEGKISFVFLKWLNHIPLYVCMYAYTHTHIHTQHFLYPFVHWWTFRLLPYFGNVSGGKSLPAMWETWVQSLSQEDPLEKEIAIHSSTLAWKMSWIEEPGRLQSMGSQRVRHDSVTNTDTIS